MSKKDDARLARKAEKQAIVTSRPFPGSAGAPVVPSKTEVSPLVSVSFIHAEPGGDRCLSRCGGDDIRHVVDCLRQLCSLSWTQVYSHKGLGWGVIPDTSLAFTRPQSVDKALPICEVRFSGKGRIFGVTRQSVYHVLWFDPGHDGTGR